MRSGSRWGLGLLAPLALYLLLRLPSWFEPHWYTDEAGYATTAWMSTHGATLYLTAWNNKPPLLFWIYDLALSVFGTGELGIHLLSTVAGLLALVGLWLLLRPRVEGWRRWAAMVLAALFLGVPLFNGDLALPENFLIAPEVWAMLCLSLCLEARVRSRVWLWAAACGALFALGALLQQTSLAPAAAAVLLLLLVRRRDGLAAAAWMVSCLCLLVGAGLAPYLIWAGPANVVYYLAISFRQYTTTTLPLTPLALVPRLLACGLLLGGTYWRRHDPSLRLLALVWLGSELLVYVLPSRAYAHFLLPAVVPACLLMATAPRPRWPRLDWGKLALPASILVTLGLWVGMVVATPSSAYTAQLTLRYYPLAISRSLGLTSYGTYLATFGGSASAEAEAVAWIQQHHLQGSSALVWSANAWPYLLADLRPVVPTPAIYMDQTWLGNDRLAQLVCAGSARLMILTQPLDQLPAPAAACVSSRYRLAASDLGGASVWTRRAAPLPMPGSSADRLQPSAGGG